MIYSISGGSYEKDEDIGDIEGIGFYQRGDSTDTTPSG
jgi:hypothetical protein